MSNIFCIYRKIHAGLLLTGSLVGRGAGFDLDTRTALMGATGGSIVTAGTVSIAIGGASLTEGRLQY
jgi:hypothetical protein